MPYIVIRLSETAIFIADKVENTFKAKLFCHNSGMLTWNIFINRECLHSLRPSHTYMRQLKILVLRAGDKPLSEPVLEYQ